MSLNILDCTIRDGGHFNRWRFDPGLVRETYLAAWGAGVSHFEVGYRHPDALEDGPFARCADEFLAECLPREGAGPRLTVMVDAARGRADAFRPADDPRTPVSVVRVASYPRDFRAAIGLVRALKGLGYEVCLNVMAAPGLTSADLEALRPLAEAGQLDCLCLADSFGSLRPAEVAPLVSRCAALGFERLGFHPHNNLQLAFANTLAALAAGVTMVDATAFGMGRGAGNLPMELLLGHLEAEGQAAFRAAPYMDLVARHYERLQADLGWGYSVARLLGGLAGAHPADAAGWLAAPGATPGAAWNAHSARRPRPEAAGAAPAAGGEVPCRR